MGKEEKEEEWRQKEMKRKERGGEKGKGNQNIKEKTKGEVSLTPGRSCQLCSAVNVIISRQLTDIWKTSQTLLLHVTVN